MIERDAIKTWEHAGLDCAIVPGPCGPLNGYVQLPEAARECELDYDDIGVEAHGGLTYGTDEDGWVGFDTGHVGDVWPFDVMKKYKPDLKTDYMSLSREWRHSWSIDWTLERLESEVNELAESLAAYDFSRAAAIKKEIADLRKRIETLKAELRG